MNNVKTVKKYRNFPFHSLSEAGRLAQTIRDVAAGRPMNRLLLADALKIKPSSSNYRSLLSSSLKYGLTTGTEKSEMITLTELGEQATSPDRSISSKAFRLATITPSVFSQFFADYNNSKVPPAAMLAKILVTTYEVPENLADECAKQIVDNGDWVGIIRPISGSKHVLMDSADQVLVDASGLQGDEPPAAESPPEEDVPPSEGSPSDDKTTELADAAKVDNDKPSPPAGQSQRSGAIFIGHGKNKGPLGKIEKLLTGFKIPFKTAVSEPNLGRPIPVKVRETMLECGSAILIFTKDEKFFQKDEDKKLETEVWRPSENVVHELGASSLLYEDRIVIFKEKGLTLASNFNSIGYIEFDEDAIEAKTAELLAELIGFGLVKITTV